MSFSLLTHTAAAGSTAGIDTTGVSLLIAAVANYGGSATVVDSKGNTWTPLTTYGGSATCIKFFWCLPASVGSGHTFTVSPGFASVAVAGFSGQATSPYESVTGATAAQPGSITPSENNELLISAICYFPENAPTVDSSFTISDTADYGAGVNMGVSLAYQIQGSLTTRNPTWSPSASFAEIQSTMAAFRAAAGATSTTLAAPGGTITVTPGSAVFLRSSTLAATGGSVAVTPGTAVLLRSSTLAATGGTVAITPGTAALLRSMVLDATGSTVTVTPGTAELVKAAPGSTTLDAPGGMVAITPGSAEMVRSLVLPATGSTVAITPGTAALIAPFASTILAAPGGTVAITPGTAVLLRTRVLSAPGSAVAITPGTAGLFKTIPGATILAAPGGVVTVTPGMAIMKLRSASADVVTVFTTTAVRQGVDSVASIGGRRWGVDPTSSTGEGR